MRLLLITGAIAALTACAIPGASVPPYSVQAPFDATVARAMLSDGPNTIKGNAFMRQQGGGVVTCAGQVVYLVPATAYAAERVQALYGNVERGVNAGRRNFRFSPEPADYLSLVRTSRCDSQGNFVFERVADGDFFVNTLVSWQVGNAAQGGQLMHRAAVKAGQTVSLVMSP
jgi:hypothetical protein